MNSGENADGSIDLEKLLDEPNFDNLVQYIENKKAQKETSFKSLEKIFSAVLIDHCEELQKDESNTTEIFACYERGLDFFPGNCDILNELANWLVR
jgi:hypothetical protein